MNAEKRLSKSNFEKVIGFSERNSVLGKTSKLTC